MVTDRQMRRLMSLFARWAIAPSVGGQGGDGPRDGAEVPPGGAASQRLADGSRLADSGQSGSSRLAVGGRAVVAEPGPGGQDVLEALQRAHGGIWRRPVADVAASGEALAGSGRSGPGGVLCPGASSRRLCQSGLSPHDPAGGDDRPVGPSRI